MKPSVAVVGGGWAGCAAALILAEAGVNVTLFEASRTLGGRARAAELDGRQVDNGQHMLLGAYATTLDLLTRLGRHEADSLWRRPLRLDTPPAFSLACPPWPAPFNLLAGRSYLALVSSLTGQELTVTNSAGEALTAASAP